MFLPSVLAHPPQPMEGSLAYHMLVGTAVHGLQGAAKGCLLENEKKRTV